MRHVLKRLIAAPVLPFALCFATLAFAESNHAAWVRAAMESLPCFVEDRGDPDKSAQLDAIADEINNRPRKGLGVRTPLAVYRQLLVAHAQPQSNTIH